MLDRVVLRAAGRIVGHLNIEPQVASQVAQFLLEAMLAIAVATAAIAEEEQPRGTPVLRPAEALPPPPNSVARQFADIRSAGQVHQALVAQNIVHAIGHQAVFRRDEIVVAHAHQSIGDGPARMMEIAQDLLLFRVDAQDGTGGASILVPQLGDVSELGVTMLVVARGFVLEGLPARQAELLEQHPPQGVHADREALVLQLFGQIGDRTIGPADAFIDRRTGRVLLDQSLQRRHEFGLRDASWLAAPLFFGRGPRPRPGEVEPGLPGHASRFRDRNQRAWPHRTSRHARLSRPQSRHTAAGPSQTVSDIRLASAAPYRPDNDSSRGPPSTD